MLTWIIDDFGRVFRSGSRELTASLGYTDGGRAVEQYAIENMGHIGITERAGVTHIKCRPDLVPDRTVAALFYWLMDRWKAPVVLSWLDDIWHLERPMPHSVAVSYLNHLLDKRTLSASAKGPRLLSRHSAAVKARWAERTRATTELLARGVRDHEFKALLDQTYNGRWIIVAMDVAKQSFDTVDRGDGYSPLDPALIGPREKFSFAAMRDRAYWDWVLANFKDTIARDQARFEVVDAIVEWPRTGDMRTRYWRAVIPLRTAESSHLLLSVSGNDSSINLRPDDVEVARHAV